MSHDKAGKQGERLENTVISFLDGYVDLRKNISTKEDRRIRLSENLEVLISDCKILSKGEPFFLQHFAINSSIYNVPWFVDFIVWHQEVFPKGMIAEVKQQSVAGSVDEKFPFVVRSLKNIAQATGCASLLFCSGGGMRDCSLMWCKNEEDDCFTFVNTDAELRHFLKTGRKKKPSDSRNKLPEWMK